MGFCSRLLVEQSCNRCYLKGQWGLYDLLSRSAEAVNLEEYRGSLIQHIEDMELVLKDDIGVFLVENQDRRKIRYQE
jgi:hypothetical protein